MNIFDQYGIKEVADVTLYSIHKKKDGSGDIYYVPALYLDTLKISTTEKTSDNVWAQGGKGNARLINWDFGKTINVSLEDALCTPASLGLCWNGVLSADWKDAQLDYNTDVCYCKNPLSKISRIEKCIFPGQNNNRRSISTLLPKIQEDDIDEGMDLLRKSSIVDGTEIGGSGLVQGHGYRWKMAIESGVKSIAVIPDRFFDIKGRSYNIDQDRKVSVTSLPTYENYKDAIIYKINSNSSLAHPKAKIIFDDYMENLDTRESNKAFLEKIITVQEGTGKTAVISGTQVIYIKTGGELPPEYEVGESVSYQELIENGYARDITTSRGGTMSFGPIAGWCTIKGQRYSNGWNPELDNNAGYSTQYSDQYTSYFFPIDIPSTEYEIKEGAYGVYIEIPVYKNGVAPGFDNFFFDRNERAILEYLNMDVTIDDHGYIVNSKVYAQNRTMYKLFDYTDPKNPSKAIVTDYLGSIETNVNTYVEPCEAQYLAIIVDNNDDYHALLGTEDNTSQFLNEDFDDIHAPISWHLPKTPINVLQFKGIDMWLRFESINAMIYFLITKYEQDIIRIKPSTIDAQEDISIWGDGDGTWAVNKQVTKVKENLDSESKAKEGKIWAYINPRTMQPYEDDYWFHQGEVFYVKSLTVTQEGKRIKGNKITVQADQWPGMYMMVGETYIRERDSGEDEHMQIRFPLCKVRSDHTLTLQADGDPTVFNFELEVARPANGTMMELITYETAKRMIEGENGCFYAIDGSTEVLSE